VADWDLFFIRVALGYPSNLRLFGGRTMEIYAVFER
jgi:hypothetical protein